MRAESQRGVRRSNSLFNKLHRHGHTISAALLCRTLCVAIERNRGVIRVFAIIILAAGQVLGIAQMGRQEIHQDCHQEADRDTHNRGRK